MASAPNKSAAGGASRAAPAAATPARPKRASVTNSAPGSNLPASAGVASRALTTVSSPLPAGEATAAVSTRGRELNRLCVLVQEQMHSLVRCGEAEGVSVVMVVNGTPKVGFRYALIDPVRCMG